VLPEQPSVLDKQIGAELLANHEGHEECDSDRQDEPSTPTGPLQTDGQPSPREQAGHGPQGRGRGAETAAIPSGLHDPEPV